MTPPTPLGYFLVRAWGEEGRLYARITSSLDIDAPQTKHLTTDPEDVIRRIRAWLNDARGADGDPPQERQTPPDVNDG